MRVKANTACFIGGARRKPGDVFEVPDSFNSRHVDPMPSAQRPEKTPRYKKESAETAPADLL